MKNKILLISISIIALMGLFIVQLIGAQAKKPTPDPPLNPNSPPLQIDHTGSQIVSGSDFSDKKVYHIKYVNGAYENSWTSSENQDFTYATSIGDVDNDGSKEITTVVNAKRSTGKPSERYEYQKIFVYEDGSTGDPSYTSHNLGYSLNGVRDSIIADADNDGQNEIVLVKNKHIEIYKWNGNGFTHLWTGPEYEYFVWSVDVGDADNDGANEVVLAMFNIGSAIVYEYLGNNTWGNPTTTESIGIQNIDQARVRDADNDGYNEIVGGGTSKKLNIWKYNSVSGNYDNVFLSDDLGGFTQGIDVGDVDGDNKNEVVVGTSGDVDKVYVFDYNESTETYEMTDLISCAAGVESLAVGDLNGDNKDEIAVGIVQGVEVFEYEPDLQSIYYFDNGGYVEVD